MEEEVYSNEEELQKILEKDPNLLKTDKNNSLYSLGREIKVPSGFIDMLLLDNKGNIILVEAKLSKNIQSRREVVAQIFDYLSDLSGCSYFQLNTILNGKLENIVKNTNYDFNIREHIDNYLRKGKIKLIIAVDEPNDNLIKIINFFEKFTNISFKIISVRKYNNGTLFVPIIISSSSIQNSNENIKNKISSKNNNNTENNISNNFLNEVMEHYNSICESNFAAFGNNPNWRQIAINKNPRFKYFHYEFIIRPNSQLGIEIHNETNEFIELNNLMSTFNGNIKGYAIINKIVRGRNRIEIFVPYNAGKEICSLVMVDLIKMTHDKIINECKKLNKL